MSAFTPTPYQRQKYADYDVEIREARKSKVRVVVDGDVVMRVHTVVQRIPSEKKFVVLHLIGRTEKERVFGEHYGALLTRGHWARYGHWFKRRRVNRSYLFEQLVGLTAADPLVQLELEMLIDATSEVRA
jgi:hypothetical protein